jgi:hypothetical protein
MKTPLGFTVCLALLLCGCNTTDYSKYDAWTNRYGRDYSGPVAAPQVAYRIDEHRFFEVVPYQYFACARARLFYTDTAKGIHTNIAPWQVDLDRVLIIDAANDQYLVSPIIESSSGCQTGGGDLCAYSFYFSQDAGRTWNREMAIEAPVYISGSMAYSRPPYKKNGENNINGAKATLDIEIPKDRVEVEFPLGGAIKRHPILKWEDFRNQPIPLPKKWPVDRKLNCISGTNERRP